MTQRWQEADEAVESLAATLAEAAAGTADRSVRKRRPRAKRRPKSTRRHIAEVIRSHRLAPGLRVDRNMVAALLIGHRDLVTNPVLVVAVLQACSIITGRKLSAKKAAQMRAASIRVGELIARAEASPHPVPAPRIETPTPRIETPAPRIETAPPPAPAVTSPVVPSRRRRPRVRGWWLAAAIALLAVAALVVFG